ncbi:MAG TPA: L-seryl-tRNA(Sec) selenium transferase [Armatimonadota bacterium]|nr:L-seryl-tRNA(Sec) selenium transferase [Armatimonadota bacterium]
MTKDTAREVVRSLPAVDRLLNTAALKELAGRVPRSTVVTAVRQTLDELRNRVLDGPMPTAEDLSPKRIADQARDLALRLSSPSLRKAINGTGVILHTGLGRAVLPEATLAALNAVAAGHSNLETNLETGGRGSRDIHFSKLLAELCGAEAGFAVNNNAAAVMLALNTLANGKEVIVSRGQLVEIGGSFRLPDIMARSGARLVEVGTTNHTRLDDYEAAISDQTALILRVHTSNFRIVGFTSEVPIGDLVQLGRRCNIPVAEDLGSGALVDVTRFGLRGEPLVQDSVKAGADVVMFSGDKLLGGPQAGLIVGRGQVVGAMAGNPMARALRIDKLTVAALESTLRLYTDPETLQSAVPTLRFISRSLADINRSATRLRRAITRVAADRAGAEVTDGLSEIGGGSLPGEHLPTKLLAISSVRMSAADLAKAFRMAEPPIFGRVADDRFLLDLRTIEDNEIQHIVRAAEEIFRP